MSPDPSLRPYAALVAHAELELELAGRGEVTELAGLDGRWDELVGELPERPPAAAAPLLARARLIHDRTHIELLRLRESLLADVAGGVRAKRTAAGYAGAGGARSVPALDTRA